MRRTVLITGATGGIGRALAQRLADEGLRVVAAGRNPEALIALHRELGVDVLELDVLDDASIADAAQEIFAITQGRGVDDIVHAAGIAELGPLMLVTDSALERHFGTNVFGPLRVTQALVGPMKERGRGRIVHVASVVDRMTLATHGAYGASMHALRGLNDSLRQELAPFGIDVTLVEPGSVRTGFVSGAFSGLESKRWSGSRWNPVIDRLQTLQRTVQVLAVPPERAAKTIAAAVTRPRPRHREIVPTAATLVQLTAARMLPTRAFDGVVRQALGLASRRASGYGTTPHRTALITGAAGGIGAETSIALATAGFRVFATDIDLDRLAQLESRASALGLTIETMPLDITDARNLARTRLEIRERTEGGGVDLLVNNAGFAQLGPLEFLERRDLERQFDINVTGLMRVTRAFAAGMADRKQGRIINLSSIAGVFAFPLMGAYHASKFAVEALSDALRQELGPFGIDVAVVQPSFIASGFETVAKATLASVDIGPEWSSVIADVDRMIAAMAKVGGTPSDVANVVLRAATAAHPRPRYAAPPFASVFARTLPHIPSRLSDGLLRRLTHLNTIRT